MPGSDADPGAELEALRRTVDELTAREAIREVLYGVAGPRPSAATRRTARRTRGPAHEGFGILDLPLEPMTAPADRNAELRGFGKGSQK